MSSRPSASASAFEQAIDSFKKNAKLSSTEIADFEATDLGQLKATIKGIQDKQSANRKLLFVQRLGPFLESMEQYGKVIEVFLNVSDVIAFVWGPMKFILMVASNFASAFNSILDAYKRIGEQMPLLSAYQENYAQSNRMREVLLLVFQDILEFHLEALRCFRQKIWRQMFQALWRGLDLRIKDITGRMRRHVDLAANIANTVEFETSLKHYEEHKQEFEKLRRDEADRRYARVQAWLAPADVTAIHNELANARTRFPGTGNWLLRDPRFDKWFNRSFCTTPMLWLAGMPGAGKSVLASLVIDEVQKLPDATVAYFYCKEGDSLRDKFINVARAFLSQLLVHDKNLSSLMHQRLSDSGQTTLQNVKLAKELLESALSNFNLVYLVVDGIDECAREDRKEIVTWFRSIIDALPVNDRDSIRCLFVSQDDGVARKDLSTVTKLEITMEDTKKDILFFCNSRQKTLEELHGVLELQSVRVGAHVAARSQGMFLFAKLVMDNLHQQDTRADVLEELKPENFPSGLDDAYCRLLERLRRDGTEKRRNRVQMLLGWIACAKRPLMWYEVQVMVSIDLDESDVDLEGDRFRKSPKDLFGSLIEVHSDQSLRLIHTTAREYLIKSKIVHPQTVNFELSMLALAYLSFAGFTEDWDKSEVQQAFVRGYYGFHDYAMACWVLHLLDGVSGGALNEAQTQEAFETVTLFLQNYSLASQVTPMTVAKTWHEKLAIFQKGDFESYEDLCQAVVSTKRRLDPNGRGSLDSDSLRLAACTDSIRTAIETFEVEHAMREQVALLYGRRIYKCPRLNCQYFYHGFTTKEQRENHIARHERAFVCPIEGCHIASFGCSTEKELTSHMYDFHGILGSVTPEFTKPALVRERTAEAKFSCSECGQTFTRKHNLNAHKRSHTGEKRYRCTLCDQRFARQSDLKRHEKLHSGEKAYTCEGILKDGDSWGCGDSFARRDKLAAHWKSITGRACLKPCLEEEAKEKGLSGKSDDVLEKLLSSGATSQGEEIEPPFLKMLLHHAKFSHGAAADEPLLKKLKTAANPNGAL